MSDPAQRALELIEEWDAELRREIPAGRATSSTPTSTSATTSTGWSATTTSSSGSWPATGSRARSCSAWTSPTGTPPSAPGTTARSSSRERSEGRLVPFVRLDLTESPIEEAERCLDLGARGIKLHPRAQKFLLNDERLAPVFAIAAERRVPILIHGGRGLPPIAADLARLVDRYPEAQLIIAHAGIADLGELMRLLAGKKGVFFDTSAWSPIDLLDFFRQVSPEQVLYASDFPYGQQPSSLLIALRTARAAGYDDDRIRDMLAGNANRIADGEEPLEPTAATGSDTFSQPMVLARIHQYLSMATPLLWTRQPDTRRRPRPRPERLRGERRRRPRARPHPRAPPLRPRPLARGARDRGRARPHARDPAHVPADPPGRHRRGHARDIGLEQTCAFLTL